MNQLPMISQSIKNLIIIIKSKNTNRNDKKKINGNNKTNVNTSNISLNIPDITVKHKTKPKGKYRC